MCLNALTLKAFSSYKGPATYYVDLTLPILLYTDNEGCFQVARRIFEAQKGLMRALDLLVLLDGKEDLECF